MKTPNLAVCLDDLRLDLKEAMNRAGAMGFRAVDLAATDGPVSPDELSQTGRRHLRRHLEDLGLRLASLRGPVGGPAYGHDAAGERRLDEMRKVIRLAASLRVPTVSTTIGAFEDSGTADRTAALRETLTTLADDADYSGVVVAVETTDISATLLAQMLADIACPFLAACCDSGAMLMRSEDPCHVGEVLPGRIRLVRARDAVPSSSQETGHEVTHGQGLLNAERFLAALAEAGFCGDIVLTRTTGADPVADLNHARSQFQMLLG
ncbi:MAG: TIM barrel protein [Planctomycetota bacterium]